MLKTLARWLAYFKDALLLVLGQKVTTADEPALIKIRLLLLIGILGTRFFFVTFTDVVPLLEESTHTKGVLTKVIEPSPPRAIERVLYVTDAATKIRFLTYSHAKTDRLKDHVGQRIEVWSYERSGVLGGKESMVLEIMLNGEFLLNDWQSVRRSNAETKHLDAALLVLFVSFIILSLVFLIRTSARLRDRS